MNVAVRRPCGWRGCVVFSRHGVLPWQTGARARFLGAAKPAQHGWPVHACRLAQLVRRNLDALLADCAPIPGATSGSLLGSVFVSIWRRLSRPGPAPLSVQPARLFDHGLAPIGPMSGAHMGRTCDAKSGILLIRGECNLWPEAPPGWLRSGKTKGLRRILQLGRENWCAKVGAGAPSFDVVSGGTWFATSQNASRFPARK